MTFPFHGIEVSYGTEQLWFSVTVQRVYTDIIADNPLTTEVDESTDIILRTDLAVPQTAINATATAAYADTLGARNLAITGLLLAADQQCNNMAEYLVDRYSTPKPVITNLTVILNGLSTADRAAVAALDITDIIAVAWTPTDTGGAVSETLVVEGVEYRATAGNIVEISFDLSEALSDQWFTLDDATLGVLDGVYKLAY